MLFFFLFLLHGLNPLVFFLFVLLFKWI